MGRSGIVGEGKGIRQTSGFPEGHLDGELRNAEVRFGDRGESNGRRDCEC